MSGINIRLYHHQLILENKAQNLHLQIKTKNTKFKEQSRISEINGLLQKHTEVIQVQIQDQKEVSQVADHPDAYSMRAVS